MENGNIVHDTISIVSSGSQILTKTGQSDCPIAGPIFSNYWTAQYPAWTCMVVMYLFGFPQHKRFVSFSFQFSFLSFSLKMLYMGKHYFGSSVIRTACLKFTVPSKFEVFTYNYLIWGPCWENISPRSYSTDRAQRPKKTEGRFSPSTVPSKLG